MREDEFDQFYEARFTGLVRAVYLQTGDSARAEDCVQEAFVRAWQHRQELHGSDPVRWVARTAFRLAVSQWRRTRREVAMWVFPDSSSQVMPPPAELVLVHQTVRHLSRGHRCVIVLHYLYDLSVEDVALVLDISPGTVKSRLSRAREQLRQELHEEKANG